MFIPRHPVVENQFCSYGAQTASAAGGVGGVVAYAGSVVYLVWTQNRFEWSSNGSHRMDESVVDLFGLHPHNVFMVKLSYRFGV